MIKLHECEPEWLAIRRRLAEELLNLWRGSLSVENDLLQFEKWENRMFRIEKQVAEEITRQGRDDTFSEQASRLFDPIKEGACRVWNKLNSRAVLKLLNDRTGPCYCAPLYRKIDPEQYPDPGLLHLIKQDELDPGKEKPGVLIWGATGSGKTFAGWELFRRWVCSDASIYYDNDEGWYIPARAYSMPRLKNIATAAARNVSEAKEEWDDIVNRRGLLFIDDLHQAKFSSAFAERFFDLIESSVSRKRPLIVTCQQPGKKLIDKWCSDDAATVDTAEAIIRRLLDHCILVQAERTTNHEPCQ